MCRRPTTCKGWWSELIRRAVKAMSQTSLARSISRKVCVFDIASCEMRFGRFEDEPLYPCDWIDVAIEHFIKVSDSCSRWCKNVRLFHFTSHY